MRLLHPGCRLRIENGMSPAFGYPAKDHALAWRPEMRIWMQS
jgi:hypothetical protein